MIPPEVKDKAPRGGYMFKRVWKPERNQHRPHDGLVSCATKEHLSPSTGKPWHLSARRSAAGVLPSPVPGCSCGGHIQLLRTGGQVTTFKREERMERPGSGRCVHSPALWPIRTHPRCSHSWETPAPSRGAVEPRGTRTF